MSTDAKYRYDIIFGNLFDVKENYNKMPSWETVKPFLLLPRAVWQSMLRLHFM